MHKALQATHKDGFVYYSWTSTKPNLKPLTREAMAKADARLKEENSGLTDSWRN